VDSSKAPPISSITDATLPSSSNIPARAGVFFITGRHSRAGSVLGGCFRYRVVITGSVAPTASTIGLASNSPCLP